MEPRQKRAAFLRQVIRLLGLGEIKVREDRLEKDAKEFVAWRQAIPLFTSRAFTAIGPFLALCEPFTAPGGRVICMKGRKAGEELAEWRHEEWFRSVKDRRRRYRSVRLSDSPNALRLRKRL